MNANSTTKGTAAGSYGGGAMFIVIVVWVLKQYGGVDVPPDVASAAGILIGLLVHAVADWVKPKDEVVNVPVEQTPSPVIVPTVTVPGPAQPAPATTTPPSPGAAILTSVGGQPAPGPQP